MYSNTKFFCMQISSNGLITFRIPFSNFRREKFSDGFSLFQDAIIAPLWTDLILEESARLYYRVSRNPSDLDVIASLIANATLDDSYLPILAVVVTWENVPLFRNKASIVSSMHIHYS